MLRSMRTLIIIQGERKKVNKKMKKQVEKADSCWFGEENADDRLWQGKGKPVWRQGAGSAGLLSGPFDHLFKLRSMALSNSLISMGLAMCAFMPASSDFCTSSAKALAVIAMIGSVCASGRFAIERMALAAS